MFFIALRRLRWPLVVLVLIFSVSTAGMALIPGVDSEGRVWRLTIFEALYFVSYTATTIGFGELPHEFSKYQRLWVTAVIYVSVVGWAYLLASVLSLFQDKGFLAAVVESRFQRSVQGLREPFYLICGLGETGYLIAHALHRLGLRVAIIDRDERRIQEFDFHEMSVDPPVFAGDAASAEVLIKGGLLHAQCLGVLALTDRDETNLSIAVAARLLRPDLRVVCRSHTPEVSAAMTTIGVQEVINPFREFAERLAIAMRAPDTNRLLTWLTEPPGSPLPPRLPAPPGRWIVCGYGRFGTEIVDTIKAGGFDVVIIDPDAETGRVAAGVRGVAGLGTSRRALEAAGIDRAEGLVAGSDDDTVNLTIAMAAREANPDLFVIARQNLVSSRLLFEALGAELTMVSSAIIANECLAVLRTSHLSDFLRVVQARDDAWARSLTDALSARLGDERPDVWTSALSESAAPGLLDLMVRDRAQVRIGDLMRDTADRDRSAACFPLALVRDGEMSPLPDAETLLSPGDEVLFAGAHGVQRQMRAILLNGNTARYAVQGAGRRV